MFGKKPEWPPHKSRKESDEAWLERLNIEVKFKYLNWLELLNKGDAGPLIEVAEMTAAIDEVNVRVLGGESIAATNEEMTDYFARIRAETDLRMAAVREGVPIAVAQYAEDQLLLLKSHHI